MDEGDRVAFSPGWSGPSERENTEESPLLLSPLAAFNNNNKKRGGREAGALQEASPSHIPGQKTPSPEVQPTRARSLPSTSSSMSTNTGAISYVYLPAQGMMTPAKKLVGAARQGP